ncbi:YrbL family protein [Coraliomargarita parva]|uniref:YrbL family protein n=1 Tax=Coraliomargarita parva TaxID=3014050 RepID=UPI0022B423F5|nr:YrbL family protein [Coraliomargarita parva]
MIELNQTPPFAVGGKRACYLHPERADCCIKVFLPGREPNQQRKADPWWKQLRSARSYDENLRDSREICRAFEKAGDKAAAHFPHCEGFIETDIGLGLCMELITDSDGSIAISAKEYTLRNGITPESLRAVEYLERFLLQYRIQVRDPFPHNIAYRALTNGELQAVVIDGFGCSSVNPINHWVPALEKRQIRKRMARFRKGLKNTLKHRAKSEATAKGMQQ